VNAIQELFPHYLATTIPADDIRDKPGHNSVGKLGLLDEEGRTIKPDLIESTRDVLEKIREYFESSSQPLPEADDEPTPSGGLG